MKRSIIEREIDSTPAVAPVDEIITCRQIESDIRIHSCCIMFTIFRQEIIGHQVGIVDMGIGSA